MGLVQRLDLKTCKLKHFLPFQCSVSQDLCFLQDMVDKGRAFSTIKVYLSAISTISACHIGFGRDSVSQHLLINLFKGAHWRLFFQITPPFLGLTVSLVFYALCQQPFKPLSQIDSKNAKSDFSSNEDQRPSTLCLVHALPM